MRPNYCFRYPQKSNPISGCLRQTGKKKEERTIIPTRYASSPLLQLAQRKRPMVSVATRYPPDMDVVDTHLPDSDGIIVVIPVPLFFEDKLYQKRFLFLRFIFMYYFDIDVSVWAF